MPGVIVAGPGSRPCQKRSHLGGAILWLPKQRKLKSVESDLEEGCYHHPVVILSPKPQDGKVALLLVRRSSISRKLLAPPEPQAELLIPREAHLLQRDLPCAEASTQPQSPACASTDRTM